MQRAESKMQNRLNKTCALVTIILLGIGGRAAMAGTPVFPVVGISASRAQDAIIGSALSNHRFRVWGRVTSTEGASFFLSDGSSPPLKITSPANSLIVGTYVTV